MLCLGAVVIQLVNIQDVRAPALRASPFNPRNVKAASDNRRGTIGRRRRDHGVGPVGERHGRDVRRHAPVPGGLALLPGRRVRLDLRRHGRCGVRVRRRPLAPPAPGGEPVPSARIVGRARHDGEPHFDHRSPPRGSGADGAQPDHREQRHAAVVAPDPKTGVVLADYSTPSFDPAPLEAPNARGRARGSRSRPRWPTSRRRTTRASIRDCRWPRGRPSSLAPPSRSSRRPPCTTSTRAGGVHLPTGGLHGLPRLGQGDDERRRGGVRGTMADDMFATSCDPGYGQLGVKLGASTLVQQAQLFGYDSRPPIHLPAAWVATPTLPAAGTLTLRTRRSWPTPPSGSSTTRPARSPMRWSPSASPTAAPL